MIRSAAGTILLAAGFAIVGAIIGSASMNQRQNAFAQEAAAGPLRHVVLFKFKPDATKEQIQEVVAGFQALPKKIDGITAFEWGTDVSPEKLADGFTHCFVVTFKDAASRDAYLPHQAHKDFVAIALPRVEKVLVVDFFAKK
jgi:hypothetical protein